MACSKKYNIENGWCKYCSFINLLPGIKNDTVWGVYLGCSCKKHDIRYSIESTVPRRVADSLFLKDVYKKYKEAGYVYKGIIIAPILWIGVRIGGIFIKPWSSKGVDRYQ